MSSPKDIALLRTPHVFSLLNLSITYLLAGILPFPFQKKKEYDFSRLTIFLKILNIVYVELLNFAIALQHH